MFNRPTRRVLVLALGNDLLTDDAVGLHVARAVRARTADAVDIEVRETLEMGLALLDEIAGREALLLVDSIQTGRAPPGTIHEFPLDAMAGRRSTLVHFVGVGETLALGASLGMEMPGRGRVFAIEVADPFTVGTELTSRVAAAIPAAADRIAGAARALIQTPASTATARSDLSFRTSAPRSIGRGIPVESSHR